MNPFEMVVMIVAIIAVSTIIKAKYRCRTDQAGDIAPRDDEDAIRAKEEVRALKERIQVLERIVTDGDDRRRITLEREIDALRDAK